MKEFIPFNGNPGQRKKYLGIWEVVVPQKTGKSKGKVINIAIITMKHDTNIDPSGRVGMPGEANVS